MTKIAESQVAVLEEISRQNGITQRELEGRLEIRRGKMMRILARLRGRELVDASIQEDSSGTTRLMWFTTRSGYEYLNGVL